MIPAVSKPILAALAVVAAVATTTPPASAQQAIAPGGVLTGELHAMRSRDPSGKHVNSFQLVSPPRRLPGPNGLCNLETGPETFQIVTAGETEARQLKAYVGKQVSIRATEMSCAQLAGQMSDAIVSKWSLVSSH
ncbi:MAG: hypothetical protein ACLP1D_08215 [Xanthobacteraceae bacterium]|jgi:hypothetical protein